MPEPLFSIALPLKFAMSALTPGPAALLLLLVLLLLLLAASASRATSRAMLDFVGKVKLFPLR